MNEEQAIKRRDFVVKAATAVAGIMIVPRFVLGGKRPDGTKYLAPSDVISLGFIGTGKQAKGLGTSFLSTNEARIVGISDVYKAKAGAFLDRVKAHYEKIPSLVPMPTFGFIPISESYWPAKTSTPWLLPLPTIGTRLWPFGQQRLAKTFTAKNPCR